MTTRTKIISARNVLERGVYTRILKPLLFRIDPETVHDAMTVLGRVLGSTVIGRSLIRMMFGYSHPILEQDVAGIHFKNPVGLSAGFDKNGELIDIVPSVGFGFAEIGSVTGEPCLGNPKPRLWRAPRARSLVVHYGLKNDGCTVVAHRLSGKSFRIPIGASVAMTNCSANLDLDTAIADYAKAFEAMEPVASYITINISCPNAIGGQPFMDPGVLERLLVRIDSIPTTKPVFIKLSPDMNLRVYDAVLDVIKAHRVRGIICANLTKRADIRATAGDQIPEKGGLSGKAVDELSDLMLIHAYRRRWPGLVIVGVGGIFTARDAYRKIRLGASLVQLVTGMIYEGPQSISEINRGLAEMLQRDGFKSLSEAVGVDNIS